MKGTLLLGLIGLVLYGAVGCASIVSSTTQPVQINSTPPGAAVKINGQMRGNTPITLDLSRGDHHTIRVELEGYQPYEMPLRRDINGWTLGNLLFGGIVGIVIDAADGAIYRINPDNINVALSQTDAAVVTVNEGMRPSPGARKIDQMVPMNVQNARVTQAESRERDTKPLFQAAVDGQPSEELDEDKPSNKIKKDKVFEKPKKIDPRAREWSNISGASFAQGNWAEVIRTASAAINIDPRLVDPYLNRSGAYLNKGLYDLAIADADKALEIDPENPIALNNRGWALHMKGDRDRALEDLERSCDAGFQLACDNFKRIAGYTPAERFDHLEQQSQDAFAQEDWEAVIRVTTEAIRYYPENAVFYVTRAGAYANKRQLDAALEDCNRAIALDPDQAMAYNNRGYTLELLGRMAEAALEYEIACSLGLELGCKNIERCKTNIHQDSPAQ